MKTHEKFTGDALLVLALGNQHANELKYGELNPDHLFWAMLCKPAGGFPTILQALGIDLPQLWKKFNAELSAGYGNTGFVKLPMTPAAKRVLETAAKESQLLGHDLVDTEHLLLGIMAEKDTLATKLLLLAGVSLDIARQEISRLFPSTPHVTPEERAETERRVIQENARQVREQQRVNDLQDRLALWQQVRIIRHFVRDARRAANRHDQPHAPDSPLSRYLQWVTERADGLERQMLSITEAQL